MLHHQYGISTQPGFFSSSREAKYNPNNEVDYSDVIWRENQWWRRPMSLITEDLFIF